MAQYQTVSVAMRNGPRDVRALVEGPFAVHKTLGYEPGVVMDDQWTITHIGTGYMVCTAPRRKDALEAARRLLPLNDWDSITVDNRPKYRGPKEDAVSDLIRVMRDEGIVNRY